MLQKGALEPVDQPGPGFYSRLYLVEKVMGGWRPVIDLLALNGFVTLTSFRWRQWRLIWGLSGRGTRCSR